MKKFFLLFLVFTMLCGLCCTRKTPSIPAIVFEQDTFDFRPTTEGTDIAFTFIFSNPGTKTLTIEGFDISCQCIEIQKYDKVVKPKHKGEITGVLKTTGFKDNIIKTFTVKSNVPDTVPVLTVEGNIRAKAE